MYHHGADVIHQMSGVTRVVDTRDHAELMAQAMELLSRAQSLLEQARAAHELYAKGTDVL